MSVIRVPKEFSYVNDYILFQTSYSINGTTYQDSYRIYKSANDSTFDGSVIYKTATNIRPVIASNGVPYLNSYSLVINTSDNLKYVYTNASLSGAILDANGNSLSLSGNSNTVGFSVNSSYTTSDIKNALSNLKTRIGIFNNYFSIINSIIIPGEAGGTTYPIELWYNTENNRIAAPPSTTGLNSFLKLIIAGTMGYKLKYPRYITITPTIHGSVATSATNQYAANNDIVTVTTTPDSGYILNFGSLGTRIFDENDNEIFPNIITPTVFQFTMPDAAVTVTVKFISENPYSPGGTSQGETGAQGDFNNNSDTIPVPTTPDINYSDSGLVRLFNPSQSDVISFGNYLWTGLLDFETIIKAFANPMDSLISFHKVPFAVETGERISLSFAGISIAVSMPPVTKQLYDLDFGTITVPRYYGSAFDFAPYSKCKIYLPYIGEIPLNIDRIAGKTIGVQYKADCYSGTLVAYVTIDGDVYIQQSGSCLLSIPISMNNYQQMITGGFRLLAGSISDMPQIGAGFGQSASPIAETALAAVKPASDLIMSSFGKPETASSAIGGGIAGYLGVQYPYITITRPKQNLATSFNSMYGYPLNVTGYLQDYTGFVKVSDITLHDICATIQERDEIYRLLHTGIVISANTPPTYTDTEQNMKLVFEKYTGRQNSVNKAITTVLETTGTFRDYQDISNPTIRVYGDLTNVLTASNMICIPRLKRRYFIDSVTTNTANSYEITLRCDVLESFWNDFKGSLAIIERAEKQYNLELNDALFVAEQRPLFQILKFNSGFTTTSYILALSGNNGSS